jgi:hypothetical protein
MMKDVVDLSDSIHGSLSNGELPSDETYEHWQTAVQRLREHLWRHDPHPDF